MSIKTFDPSRDIVNQLQSINEYILIGGTLFTGAVQVAGVDNIKTFNHWTSGAISGGYYQSIYNVHFTAASAVELLNVTYGQSISSAYYVASSGTNKVEKNKVYRLYAKYLLGDEDSLFSIGSVDRHECIFVSLKRNQFKDEIKKGTVVLEMMFSGAGRQSASVPFNTALHSDSDAPNSFTQTIRGDVGSIKSGSTVVGQVYYQAGVMVLVPHLVTCTSSLATNVGNFWSGAVDYNAMATSGGVGTPTTGSYHNMLDAVRYRFKSIQFINQSNLHATFYFCRALNDEFNYSSNPTFIDSDGRIIPTSGTNNLQTRTYITKVALKGENNETLAVGSLSRPVKKDPSTELAIKVRLDF